MRRCRLAGLLVGFLLVVPAGAATQTVVWAGYGQNADDATGLSTGESITAGLARFLAGAGFAATLGVPTDPDASIRWGTAAGWFDQRVGRSPLGVAGAATLFAYGDPVLDRTGVGSVASLDAYGALTRGPAEIVLRAGARHGIHADDLDRTQRLLGRAGTELGVRAGALDARATLDHWRAEEGGYTQAGARVGLADRPFQAWAAVSHWLDDDLPGTGWDVGVSVPLASRVALIARGGVQAQDILFQVAPQRTWSVALQVRTGAAPPLSTLPVPVVRDARRPVTLTLTPDAIPGDPSGDPARAAPPGVAGTFSGWQTLPMRRVGARWELELVLEPGVHEYSFVTAEGEWFVPPGIPGRKPDGFGGHVGVLIVQ